MAVENYISAVDFRMEKRDQWHVLCLMDLELCNRSRNLEYQFVLAKNYDTQTEVRLGSPYSVKNEKLERRKYYISI